MKQIVVVADMKVGREGGIIITHALGSCLGLTVYDPIANVGGMLHAMLPLSKINPQKAKANPSMFVDTGVPHLFETIYNMGGKKARLIVEAMGCGVPLGSNDMFKIGERNFAILEKLLWKNEILLKANVVGGSDSRTVHFDIATGMVTINNRS